MPAPRMGLTPDMRSRGGRAQEKGTPARLVDLAGALSILTINFFGAKHSGSKLSDARLQKANLREADLIGEWAAPHQYRGKRAERRTRRKSARRLEHEEGVGDV
jgi:hypothetical protein